MASSKLIDVLIAEALGEGDRGMADVAHVILDRSRKWGMTPEEVVLQPAQFTGLTNPGRATREAMKDPEVRARVERIWNNVVSGQIPDRNGDSLHYFAPGGMEGGKEPWWWDGTAMYGQIERGNHVFAPSRPVPPGELPEVATALAVVPPPAPVPVTPSPDMRLMRNPVMSASAAPPPLPRPRPRDNTLPAVDLALASHPNPATSRMTETGEVLNPWFSDLTPTSVVGGVGSLTPERNRSMSPPAPFPVLPSTHLAAERATDPVLQAALNSRHPVRLPPLPPPMPTPPRVAPVPAVQSLPLASARAAAGAVNPELQAALGPGNSGPIPDRLAESTWGTAPDTMGSVNPQFARVAPMPMPANMRPTAVATALDVKPIPPLPIPRPGTGGPMAPTPRVPPTPMPRLDRPGVFGDRQLPGVFGIINGLSKAANNSSGPFSNPVDNLLVNVFRGGSFATPGAADAVGTNGFLYARRPDGGYVNVGRAGGYQRPQSNRPTLMGWLQSNLPQSTPSSSSSSQPSRSLRPGDRRYNPDTNTWVPK